MITRKNSKIHLGTLLDNYGAELLIKMIPTIYTFYEDMDRYLFFKMKLKVRNAINRNLSSGRPLRHVNKSTGYLKAKYKTKSIQKSLLEDFVLIPTWLPSPKFIKSVYVIQKQIRKYYNKRKNKAIILQKYARRLIVFQSKRKAQRMIIEGLDFASDCITAELLKDPCVILPDFSCGNFVFYNKSTICKLMKTYKVPVHVFFNETTQEEEIFYHHVIERDAFQNILYKSPYTRQNFTMHDVTFLKSNLVYKFGHAITLFQNRMNCDAEA
tara:strand:- start:13671 stop:14477 length:807 start_codon:yes stop_codon:yes gene_type:complete